MAGHALGAWPGCPLTRLIIAVLHNNDLNQVTWEARAMEGSPQFTESQRLPDISYEAFAPQRLLARAELMPSPLPGDHRAAARARRITPLRRG
jgi:pyruvate dehydrogenase (quinone)